MGHSALIFGYRWLRILYMVLKDIIASNELFSFTLPLIFWVVQRILVGCWTGKCVCMSENEIMFCAETFEKESFVPVHQNTELQLMKLLKVQRRLRIVALMLQLVLCCDAPSVRNMQLQTLSRCNASSHGMHNSPLAEHMQCRRRKCAFMAHQD